MPQSALKGKVRSYTLTFQDGSVKQAMLEASGGAFLREQLGLDVNEAQLEGYILDGSSAPKAGAVARVTLNGVQGLMTFVQSVPGPIPAADKALGAPIRGRWRARG